MRNQHLILGFALTWIAIGIGSRPLTTLADEPGANPAELSTDATIETLLIPIREKHKVPGLIAGMVHRDGTVNAGVTGLRRLGFPERMTINDLVHLGSDTKAMTATLIAILVEEKHLSWDSTLEDVFSEWKTEIDEGVRSVTIRQLLTHRAGLPADTIYSESAEPVMEQREKLARKILAAAPIHAPGSKFQYSNLGYIIAGHMAEQVTGKPWEELIKTRLFDPLQMPSAGFGPPGEKGKVDQPWGHGGLFPIPFQFDNPPVLGPAGTVHCSVADWSRFIVLHLRGASEKSDSEKKELVSRETFKSLQTPAQGEDYAMGWGVVQRPWANGEVLIHAGSNTMWMSIVAIAPKRDIAFFAVTNMGPPAGQKACDEALATLIKEKLKPE